MKKKRTIVDNILKNDMCTGCGICVAISGSDRNRMIYNVDGFLRPKITSFIGLEKEEIIKNICPGKTVMHDNIPANYNKLWGPVVMARKGYALDKHIRFAASSGGAISAVATFLLKIKLVDKIVHIGASKINPLENEVKISTNPEQILANAGSRYSPSSPLQSLDTLLNESGTCALIAKPCDISAVRRYAQYDKRVNDKIKYLLSFFCAGVPSIKGTYEILDILGIAPDNVKSIQYRGRGWPGKTRIITYDDKSFELTYEEAWSKILSKHIQFRCKICSDGTGEFADISFADAWEVNSRGWPVFTEKEGFSIIITRTEEGEKLLKQCQQNGILAVENMGTGQVAQMQPYHVKRKRALFPRLIALKLFLRPGVKYNNKYLFYCALQNGVMNSFKQFLGIIRRLLIISLKYKND